MERPSPEEIEYQIEHYDESYVDEIHISMSICLALATVAVILRVLARRMSKASIGKDDHMIFVALVARDPSPNDLPFSHRFVVLTADPGLLNSSLPQVT